MQTQKQMREVLLCSAAIMALVVVSAAQMGPPPLPPGVEEELVPCLREISACQPFADSTTTTPPAICCEPLESVIANNVSCLCLLFGNDDVIQALEIDVPKAITLPQRCGLQPFDLSSNCQGLMVPSRAPTMSSADAPASVSEAPLEAPSVSTTAGPPVSGRDDSGTISIARTGSVLMGSLLLCTTFMFY